MAKQLETLVKYSRFSTGADAGYPQAWCVRSDSDGRGLGPVMGEIVNIELSVEAAY
jgi:hypothetical protein